MEDQIRHSIPLAESIHHSACRFQTWPELCTQIRREVLQAQSSTEIAYTSVCPDWGPLIVDSLDNNEDMESLNAAINYNSVTETLLIKVRPSPLLGCHLNWIRMEECDWREQNLVTDGDLRLLRVSVNARQISLWILIGARPFVKVVVIIQYARKGNTNQVEGKAELYVGDANGNPALQQEATIFPATQSECSLGINAGDLFGPVLPQGLQANTVLPLSIENLRNQARDAMVHMNMVPAT
ncbi:uncharacterized protein CDV56_101571 [Aspergillus thermomutatus]|uniref:Uncharacterized protein n=1 Tax=Aspergillus thermomutatus TaxID=41047 RepID=A0A397G577_ASPTH|nr:uncharacterized protein CDV56_101571 [Aspergillus thermomutatus]RHZ43300.1 hypothetical protein CDV56_101571 [Aspergillus thermomutatus]